MTTFWNCESGGGCHLGSRGQGIGRGYRDGPHQGYQHSCCSHFDPPWKSAGNERAAGPDGHPAAGVAQKLTQLR